MGFFNDFFNGIAFFISLFLCFFFQLAEAFEPVVLICVRLFQAVKKAKRPKY